MAIFPDPGMPDCEGAHARPATPQVPPGSGRPSPRFPPAGGVVTGRSPISVQVVLAALAEPRRADMIRLLEKGYRTQRELTQELEMSQPLVSHHLRILQDAGLVTSTTCERVRVYMLRASTLDKLSARLTLMAARARSVAVVKPC